ncbi:helix-turn-helix transcriptional regulator [Nocardioides euryhalodurans]|uniref:Helix-turn-helix transcriptional regulator n=1 Tax=Nocardioides euryhalodurans TaxID=2518370 RepID=A0A4V1BDT8_9ACTN|nr:helix-turn-helix transcriptional regulator [Nocardioides euryhalodurans]QBR92272.1 helix-turn-helix transcriptional regulator [Nocardioides euryhalodurans]
MGVVELEQTRAAFDRGDWEAAFAGWSAAGADALTSADLEDLATAAELLGRHDDAVGALQQAFVRWQQAGDLARAVRCTFRLSMTTATHGEPALAAGWTSRAEGLLEEVDGDVPERGWVAFLRMFRALGTGAYAEAAAAADEATEVGRRHRDADLIALGLCSQGRLALYAGRVADGLALLDESMVRVVAGETSPIIAGHVYCTAIEGCQEISDFARMAEWTSALERWCAAQPGLLAFTGQCAVHRGQLLRQRGEWSAALDELELASRRYREVGSPDAAGLAAYEAGDVHRLRGDTDEADAAYQRAADHGFDPQPGLALLWLSRGRTEAARGAIDRLLAEGGPVQRCRVLPAAVEVLVASGDLERAREAAVELTALASAFGCVSLEAMAAQASGAVELAAGDASGALPYLRKAHQLWSRAESPFERARAQVLMGRALRAVGDDESSRRELEAARSTFRRLGAAPAAEEASLLLAPVALPAGLTAREVEVLRLVASGRSNAQIAAELVLSEKTVARHLSNIFGKLDVGSRTAATAYAFAHGLV